MGKHRVCSMAGCTREAIGDLCLNKIDYTYIKSLRRSKKKTLRVGRMNLCQHHFYQLAKWFNNYHALIERVGEDPDEYTSE